MAKAGPALTGCELGGRCGARERGEIANSHAFVYLRQHRRRRDGSSEPAEHGRHTSEQGEGLMYLRGARAFAAVVSTLPLLLAVSPTPGYAAGGDGAQSQGAAAR